MTALEATGPGTSVPTIPATAPPAPPSPGTGTARFVGNERIYWRLMARGAVLLLCTLGIYRFWLATDQRRFLWANTEIAGDALEYTGTARELLIGFLIAIAVLLPIYAGFFLAAMDLGFIGRMSGVLAFILLALFGHFAIYRARRYRLTRTVFRGVRLHQTGSAWLYAVYSIGMARRDLAHRGPCLSLGAGDARTLQAAAHLLWRRRPGALPDRAPACSCAGSSCGSWWSGRSSSASSMRSRASTGARSPRRSIAAATTSSGAIESASPNFAAVLAFAIIASIWSACRGRAALSGVPDHHAALVDVGAAVRRHGGNIAAADRPDVRPLFALPRLLARVRRRPRDRLGLVLFGLSLPLLKPLVGTQFAEVAGVVGGGRRLRGGHARLLDHLSGHREAQGVAVELRDRRAVGPGALRAREGGRCGELRVRRGPGRRPRCRRALSMIPKKPGPD